MWHCGVGWVKKPKGWCQQGSLMVYGNGKSSWRSHQKNMVLCYAEPKNVTNAWTYKSIYSTDIFREPREVTLTKQQGGLGFNIVGGECDSEALFLQKSSLILQLSHPRWGWRGYFRLLHPSRIPCWYMSMAEKGRSGGNIILAKLNLILSNISFADPKCQPDRHCKSFPWLGGQGIIFMWYGSIWAKFEMLWRTEWSKSLQARLILKTFHFSETFSSPFYRRY